MLGFQSTNSRPHVGSRLFTSSTSLGIRVGPRLRPRHELVRRPVGMLGRRTVKPVLKAEEVAYVVGGGRWSGIVVPSTTRTVLLGRNTFPFEPPMECTWIAVICRGSEPVTSPRRSTSLCRWDRPTTMSCNTAGSNFHSDTVAQTGCPPGAISRSPLRRSGSPRRPSCTTSATGPSSR